MLIIQLSAQSPASPPALCTHPPSMMDTVLNLGLNDHIVTGLAAKMGERFAYDCYRCALKQLLALRDPHRSKRSQGMIY